MAASPEPAEMPTLANTDQQPQQHDDMKPKRDFRFWLVFVALSLSISVIALEIVSSLHIILLNM
jgi:hypothetical protein